MQNTNFDPFDIASVNAARGRLGLQKFSRRDYLAWLERYCIQAGITGHTEIVHEADEPVFVRNRSVIPLKAYLVFAYELNGWWLHANGRAREPEKDLYQIAKPDAKALLQNGPILGLAA
jgi:hypothetical protein